MDDSDDKARRNLVIAAGAICLLSFLDIPLELLIEKLVYGPPPNPAGEHLQKHRVWLGATTSLTYLALRYRFSNAFMENLISMKAEWKELVRDFTQAHIQRSIKRMKIGDPYPKVLEDFTDDIAIFNPSTTKKIVGATFPNQLEKTIDDIGEDLYGGKVYLVFETTEPPGGHISRHTAYKLEGAAKNRVRGVSMLFLLLYSRTCLEIVLPSILAIAASVVCISRLFR